MSQTINPLLKPENRKAFIQQAMSSRQNEVIEDANAIIGDVINFEKSVHKKFLSYTGKH